MFKFGSFPTRLQALIKGRRSGYLEPVLTTFSTFDFLVYQPDHLEFFLKITAGTEHLGDPAGFECVEQWLELKDPTSHLCPSETQPWRFIFVVPEENAASFVQQSFGKVWNSKVKQYVLRLSEKDIWDYRDPSINVFFLNR